MKHSNTRTIVGLSAFTLGTNCPDARFHVKVNLKANT